MGAMRRVMLALKSAAIDDVQTQQFPTTLQFLMDKEYVRDARIFACPNGRHGPVDPKRDHETSDFVYVGAGVADVGDTKIIIPFPKAHGAAGGNVFYMDGQVAWLAAPPEEIQRRADVQRAASQKKR